jgi:hypothetical protein
MQANAIETTMTREKAELIRRFHGLERTTPEQVIDLAAQHGDELHVYEDHIIRRLGIPLEPALAWKGDDGLWYTTEAWVRDELRERLGIVAFLD